MNASIGDVLTVCLGYPALLAPRFIERTRAIDPRIRVVELPVDEGGDWIRVAPAEPHAEPPPWAGGFAAERKAALAEAEVLVALHTPADLMQLAPRLRFIQGFGAGIEQFGRAGVPCEGVTLCNASGLGAPSIAEFVIARLLQIWKRLPEIDALQRERHYQQTYGRTFAGSTVGIVGLGAIGRAVGERARALGTRVLGMKRSEPNDADRACAHEFFKPDALHTMLGRCDAVVVAAPETPETLNIIDAAAIAAMPDRAVLVNVARGALVDERAVATALRADRLAAAALDVFVEEPLPSESDLWDVPNLYASAHCSVSVDRYVDDAFDLFEDNLGRFVRGETLRNQVDTRAMGFKAGSTGSGG